MNTLHAYRSVFLSRIIAAFVAALLTAGAVVLPDALIVLDSATVDTTSHVPARGSLAAVGDYRVQLA
jgi:hypothetical protein